MLVDNDNANIWPRVNFLLIAISYQLLTMHVFTKNQEIYGT